MRYNIISYLIGEGIRNVFKNKKSTGASLTIMCMAMLIFGLFFIIGENINHVMKIIQEEQGMQVFIESSASDERVKEIGQEIKNINGVNTIEFVSKADTLNEIKAGLKEYSGLLEAFPEDTLKSSYIVTLTDLELNESVQNSINSISNIAKITSSNKTISTLVKLARGIRIVTFVILVILIAISIFIIANTIKLTVHARRKEISIMKYVGATNSFIRWPFIVEGIIIGITSAFITIVIVGALYNVIANGIMNSDIIKTLPFISFVSFSDMFNLIICTYLAIGIGIGIIGSSISMKKYLEV